jgi:hypothetical protein
LSIFLKSVEKIQISLKSDKKTGTLHEQQYTFFITSHSFLLRMRNVSDKSFKENKNTHFMFNNVPPPQKKKLCHLWDNVEKYVTAGKATDDNMACAHFTLSTWGYKHTLSEYVILTYLLQQQWLLKCVSTLHYRDIACPVIFTPCLEHLYVIQNVCNHTDLSHTHI